MSDWSCAARALLYDSFANACSCKRGSLKQQATQSVLRIFGVATLIAGFACADGSAPVAEPPPTLTIGSGERVFGLLLGTHLRVPVTLRSVHGDTVPLPPTFGLVSRAPAVVSVESSTVIRARAMGTTWLVGSVVVDAEAIADSVEVTVACTLELQIKLTPPAPWTLSVGASITPAIELLSCGGQLQLTDTIRWVAGDSTVIRVDSVSGRTTGLRAGQTALLPHGARYPALPGIPVTVVSPP
jgi:hypothetical protein